MVKENLAPKPIYRVQVGAFSTRAKAEDVVAKLKAAGFKDAIIK
jgi:cell division septation protein DedD